MTDAVILIQDQHGRLLELADSLATEPEQTTAAAGVPKGSGSSTRGYSLGMVVDADHRPGVLLDLDGTLVDTGYLHTLAWSRALADVGEWAPMHAIHRLVGMGGDQLLPKLLGRPLPEADERRGIRYRELWDDIRPFPGAKDLLGALHDYGAVVVLATSSPPEELDVSLQLLGGRDVVDAVTSKADVERSKPHPDLLVAAVEIGGVTRQRSVAVGDSVWDVRAARAAGLGCICVETGGFSRHELLDAGALGVYRDVGELAAQLLTSALGPLLLTASPVG